MNIVEVDWIELKLHNPQTNEIIIDLVYFDLFSKSLIGAWFSDNLDDPYINNKSFENDWIDFQNKYVKDAEGIKVYDFHLESFLREYNNPDWKVIRHSNSWLAHSLEGATVWYVVEKDIVAEEVDLSEFF